MMHPDSAGKADDNPSPEIVVNTDEGSQRIKASLPKYSVELTEAATPEARAHPA
jgi:hypothetical protein